MLSLKAFLFLIRVVMSRNKIPGLGKSGILRIDCSKYFSLSILEKPGSVPGFLLGLFLLFDELAQFLDRFFLDLADPFPGNP